MIESRFVLGALLSAVLLGVVAVRNRRKGRTVKHKYALALLVVYLLLAWEQIPTYILHKYLCASRAGSFMYVQPAEWVAQNRAAAATIRFPDGLSPREKLSENTVRYHWSDRIIKEYSKTRFYPLAVSLNESSLHDTLTGTVLARTVRVSSGYIGFALGGVNSWRFWVGAESCGGRFGEEAIQYKDYIESNRDKPQ